MTRYTFHVARGSHLYREWLALSPEGYEIGTGDTLAEALRPVLRFAAESLPSGADWRVTKYAPGIGEPVSILPATVRGIVAESMPGKGDPAYLEG